MTVASGMRIQVAMWLEPGFCCIQCKRDYKSVDDFLERNPRLVGILRGGPVPVDDKCWDAFVQKLAGV